MKIEDMIKVIAGMFVFVSSLLGLLVSPYWLLFTMFVGLNLFQYGFTGFCPMEKVLVWLGFDGSGTKEQGG